MKHVREIRNVHLSRVRFVCTDIDDTITKDGKLGALAYQAMWDLTDAGIKVIPVTGRPAGWCDLIARQWPVDAVVGENGAFAFYLEEKRLKHLFHPSVAPSNAKGRLEALRRKVLDGIPGTRIAKDQFSRMFDLAIDFREEPPDLGFEVAREIAGLCEESGAHAKISSIHVNAWYGDYTKVDMLQFYLENRWSVDVNEQKDAVVYCGDSPNDEPMFERFPLSCGVANIEPMLPLICHKPAYITEGSHGDGFAELAEIILKVK